MKKINYPCPCGGRLKWKKEKIVRDEIDCGILDIEYCETCGEEYLPDESLEIVEMKLKENNLWGVERKEVQFWKSGKSIVLRLPTKITSALGINKIKKGYVYPEGKNKFVVEF
ncbi:hypothetical protein HY837_04170 [archaeon]|nr:hypothetical protein [archaeon]